MVEIIEQREWSKDIICRMCTSGLRIKQRDLDFKDVANDNNAMVRPCVECPVCETLNWFEWDDIPGAVIKHLNQ